MLFHLRFRPCRPFGHGGKAENGLGVVLSPAVVTEGGKIYPISAEARRHRREHGVRIGETAEQKRAGPAMPRADIAPDGDDAAYVTVGSSPIGGIGRRESRSMDNSLRSGTKPECISAETERASARVSVSSGHIPNPG